MQEKTNRFYFINTGCCILCFSCFRSVFAWVLFLRQLCCVKIHTHRPSSRCVRCVWWKLGLKPGKDLRSNEPPATVNCEGLVLRQTILYAPSSPFPSSLRPFYAVEVINVLRCTSCEQFGPHPTKLKLQKGARERRSVQSDRNELN